MKICPTLNMIRDGGFATQVDGHDVFGFVLVEAVENIIEQRLALRVVARHGRVRFRVRHRTRVNPFMQNVILRMPRLVDASIM